MQEKNLGELKKRGKVVGKKKEMPGLETKVSAYYEAVSSMTLPWPCLSQCAHLFLL